MRNKSRYDIASMSASRIASLVVAIGYLVAVVVSQRGINSMLMYVAIVLLFPLALIWFPDKIGKAKGYWYNHQYIDQESPPVLIAFAGRLFLVGLPVVFLLIWR